MGYFLPNVSIRTDFASCGTLDRHLGINVMNCFATDARHYICQEGEGTEQRVQSQSDSSVRRGTQLFKPSNSSVQFTRTFCPAGHWTHEFLACDLQSACWQLDNLGERRAAMNTNRNATPPCQSLLSTMFTCRSSVERVPYSLVCDHSQDCQDASDEDFCVYPPCSGKWRFECTNKQVRQVGKWRFECTNKQVRQ